MKEIFFYIGLSGKYVKRIRAKTKYDFIFDTYYNKLVCHVVL